MVSENINEGNILDNQPSEDELNLEDGHRMKYDIHFFTHQVTVYLHNKAKVPHFILGTENITIIYCAGNISTLEKW